MPSEFDRDVGQRLRYHREVRGLPVSRAAIALGITTMSYRQAEIGLRRLYVSEIFVMKKIFDIPIEDFFTFDGIYISDLNDNRNSAELLDIIHYFPNINDMNLRHAFIEQIRDDSSIF